MAFENASDLIKKIFSNFIINEGIFAREMPIWIDISVYRDACNQSYCVCAWAGYVFQPHVLDEDILSNLLYRKDSDGRRLWAVSNLDCGVSLSSFLVDGEFPCEKLNDSCGIVFRDLSKEDADLFELVSSHIIWPGSDFYNEIIAITEMKNI